MIRYTSVTRDVGKFIYCISVLVLSLSLNVVLGWRLIEQRRSPASGLAVPGGFVMPQLPVKDLDGSRDIISFARGGWTVLYVMSPDCPFCAENQNRMRNLAARAGPSIQFVGLSLTNKNLKAFIGDRAPFPTYDAGDLKDLYGLTFRAIPQTILISPTGVVRSASIGRLSESLSVYKELLTLINSHLQPRPGSGR